MTRGATLVLFAVLAAIGAAWGATQPLAKIAVSTGHKPLGILVWQGAVGAVLLGGLSALQGHGVPRRPRALRLYAIIALIGTVIPGIASYSAAVHLPAGVLSILLSSVPMMAFPIALALGLEPFRAIRLTGLVIGFCGVAMIIVPETGLPPGVPALWVAIALIASLCYAFEGNYVARWGTEGLGPVTVLAGASMVTLAIALPLALATGQWIDPTAPLGPPERAILASGALHAVAYSGYVWLVGRAGSVFAVQVSYPVTFFGVLWAMLFLGEGYSTWFWAAAALLMAGVALVQPRPAGLAGDPAFRQNDTV